MLVIPRLDIGRINDSINKGISISDYNFCSNQFLFMLVKIMYGYS